MELLELALPDIPFLSLCGLLNPAEPESQDEYLTVWSRRDRAQIETTIPKSCIAVVSTNRAFHAATRASLVADLLDHLLHPERRHVHCLDYMKLCSVASAIGRVARKADEHVLSVLKLCIGRARITGPWRMAVVGLGDDESVKTQLVANLGRLAKQGDTDVVGIVLERLWQDIPTGNKLADPKYHRRTCLKVLGELSLVDDVVVIGAVLPFLHDTTYQSAALKCLLSVCSRGNSQVVHELCQMVREALAPEVFLRELLPALARLSMLQDSSVMELLLDLVQSPASSVDIRESALELLPTVASRGHDATLQRLYQHFGDPGFDACSSRGRCKLFRVLEQLACAGDPQAVQCLLVGLKDTSKDVRTSAASTLQRLGKPETAACECVLQYLEMAEQARDKTCKNDFPETCEALDALGCVAPRGDSVVIARVKGFLHDQNSMVRSSAVCALGRTCEKGNAETEALLYSFLEDPDSWVKAWAIRGIGFYVDETVLVEKMKAFVLTPPPGVGVGNAIEVMGLCASPEDAKAVKFLYDQLKSSDHVARYSALVRLPRFGDVGRTSEVKLLLADAEEYIRVAALTILQRLGDANK